MDNLIDITTGQIIADVGNKVLRTGSVGSCLVITMSDKEKQIGGMAHSLLPSRSKDISPKALELDAKYVDESVELLLDMIMKLGGRRDHLDVKIAGGASMFKTLGSENHGIGYQNIEAAKAKIQELGLVLENENVGGAVGRIVELNLMSGILEVTTKI